MDFYKRALELRQDILKDRRWFHQTAEVGLDMPKARDYVMERLREYGLQPWECGHGVAADLGSGSPRLLLRADMDALPMEEESGLPYACTEGRCHACGHDCHAAMLLTAARLLKERESELKGSVRLMFQPAEETLEGCRDMIDHGILDPKPDAAMALHVMAGQLPLGLFLYHNAREAMMFSVENFEITIRGRGSHGAYPHRAVDPINIGAHIHLALQALLARETDPTKACIVTIGQFRAGTAGNILPETAVLQGAVRSNDEEVRHLLTRRVEEICTATAAAFGGTAQVQWTCRIPTLVCDPTLADAMAAYLQELPIPGLQVKPGIRANASEDFALLAEQVPSVFFYISAGFPDSRGEVMAHNPKVRFNEDALPMGAAGLAHCAVRWLQDNG